MNHLADEISYIRPNQKDDRDAGAKSPRWSHQSLGNAALRMVPTEASLKRTSTAALSRVPEIEARALILSGVHRRVLECQRFSVHIIFDVLKAASVERILPARDLGSNAYAPVHCTDLLASATVEAYLLAVP